MSYVKNSNWESPRNWDGSYSWGSETKENQMINEEEINNLIKLNRDDLAVLAIKENEAELQRLRDEVKKLTEEVRRIKGDYL